MKGLDSTFLIDILRKDSKALEKALEIEDNPFIFTTEANVFEIITGIKKDVDENRAISDLETLLNKINVLPLDHKGAIKAGLISRKLRSKGNIIDDIDCLTAGILLTNGCNTIVTRNVKHFDRIDELKVESY